MEQTDIRRSSSRSRELALTPAQFFRVAVAQLVGLWVIVGTGAAVRLTDSGLGCRSWPGCEEGSLLPQKDYHGVIEFSNRLLGGLVIATTLLTWLAARWTPRLSRHARRLALAIFVGTLAQGPLGLITVASELHWPIVIAHLMLSMLLLAGAVVLVLEARGLQVGHSAPLDPELRRLAVVFSGACLALLFSGAFTTAAGPHSGGGSGDDIDRFGSLEPAVYAHAGFVALFGCLFLYSLGYLAARRDRARRLFRASLALLVLVLVQMGLGELQWRLELPWGLVLVHVVLAATVWMGAVALATLFWRPLAHT